MLIFFAAFSISYAKKEGNYVIQKLFSSFLEKWIWRGEALFTKQHVSSMEIVELNNSTINSKTREIIYKDVGGQANNT